MPKPKNHPVSSGKSGKKNKKNDGLGLKTAKSSLGEFVKRSLPTDEEVERFDEFAEEEAREEGIEESLSEIYQDDNGDIVDVKKLDIKKGRGFFFWLLTFLFILAALASAVYGFYYMYYGGEEGSESIYFSIEGEENILAGEEFFYTVNCKNLSNVDIGNIEIRLIYPENFVFLDSAPVAQAENNFWKISRLAPHRSEQIKIKGKIIGLRGSKNIITGSMTYVPSNFSSEFKKEAVFENKISAIGVDFDIESPSGVLVGEESEIIIKYKAEENNFINNFLLSIEPLSNMEFITEEEKGADTGIWRIDEVGEEEKELKIKFKIIEKKNPQEELILKFEHLGCADCPEGKGEGSENYYVFFEKTVSFEVIKSDLNLNLIINGSRGDQGVDLGQTLNYSIVYANKGDSEMKDVIIMAVLNSEVLDWKSLKDEHNGQIGNNTISWSKNEIPALESLDVDEEGVIDFSIKVKPFEEIEIEPGRKYEIESYAQFSIGNVEAKDNEDNKSNTIINKINSDLFLDEQVRYFNDDNIAVGSGPLPPKAGETTSYKVYWTITNNLHELNNLRIKADLPDYVRWGDKNKSTVGTIQYDEAAHQVIWNIGLFLLPISVYEAKAEFNISITPAVSDVDKIMVLLPGTVVEALDIETKAAISKTTKAKTTRLEDDEIAETDGRVVE
jgi:hypothetical protein